MESQLTAVNQLALVCGVALMILRASALGSSEASLKTCSRPGIGGWVHRRCCAAWCMLPHLMRSGLIIWTGSPIPAGTGTLTPPVCVMLCKQSKSARRSPELGPGKLCLMCILLVVVSSEVDVRFGHWLDGLVCDSRLLALCKTPLRPLRGSTPSLRLRLC